MKVNVFYFIFLIMLSFGKVISEDAAYTHEIDFSSLTADSSKDDILKFKKSLMDEITKEDFYKNSIPFLVDGYNMLADSGSKDLLLLSSFVKNIIIWNICYDLAESEGHFDYPKYREIIHDLEVDAEILKEFYGKKDVPYKNTSKLDLSYLNMLVSNSAISSVSENNVKRFNQSLFPQKLILSFENVLSSDDNLAYAARIIAVDKIMNVNLKLLLAEVEKGTIRRSEISDKKLFLKNIHEVDLSNKEYIYPMIGLMKSSEFDCYLLFHDGRVEILSYKPYFF